MPRFQRPTWSREPSIWDEYLTQEGQYPAKTAWAAPTYEHWWPFPFPAPDVPGAPSPAQRLADPEGTQDQVPSVPQFAPSFPATPTDGAVAGPATAPGITESGLPGLAGLVGGAAAGQATKRLVGGESPAPIPGPPSLDLGTAGGTATPGGGVAPVAGGIPGMPGAVSPFFVDEAGAEAAGSAASALDLYGQAGELLTSGPYGGVGAAETAAGEAGAGLTGPTAGGAGGWGPGLATAGAGLAASALNPAARTLPGQGVNLAASLLAGPYAIPFLALQALTGLGPLIYGPEKESAQSRANVEQSGARIAQAEGFSRANTLADIADIFNRGGGRAYAPEDITPEMIERELGGSAFDLGATGGSQASINRGMLRGALLRAGNPWASEMIPGYEHWTPGAQITSEGDRGRLGGIQFGPTDEELQRQAQSAAWDYGQGL